MRHLNYDLILVAWDSSAWVRTYALFLEERLECFRVLKYDIEAERLLKPAEGQEKVWIQSFMLQLWPISFVRCTELMDAI